MATAARYKQVPVIGESASNSNKLGFELRYDMIIADGKTNAQTVLLPPINDTTRYQKAEIFASDITNDVTIKNAEDDSIIATATLGMNTYLNTGVEWIKL